MFSDKIFQITLAISAIVHAAILLQNPNLNIFPQNKKEQNLEVSYMKNTREPKDSSKMPSPKRELFLKSPPKINIEKISPPPFIDKENIFKRNSEAVLLKPAFTKPESIRPDIIAVKKKITLPPVQMDKMNNPSYISYYQIVREKIRRAAYQNYIRTETGEVYLSFIISNDGGLQEMQFIQEKSSFSPYLKETALCSIKDASPFPAFPKELDYPQLSFNVVISFEIE